MNRRSPAAYGFVNWPEPTMERYPIGPPRPTSGFADTREGGMECWLIVGEAARETTQSTDPVVEPPPSSVRDVCITGFEIGVLCHDAVPDDWFQARWRAAQDQLLRGSPWGQKQQRLPSGCGGGSHGMTAPMPVEAAVCIGATGLSIVDFAAGGYWRPRPEEPDLTAEGVALYGLMRQLYGFDAVQIVMVLDT